MFFFRAPVNEFQYQKKRVNFVGRIMLIFDASVKPNATESRGTQRNVATCRPMQKQCKMIFIFYFSFPKSITQVYKYR